MHHIAGRLTAMQASYLTYPEWMDPFVIDGLPIRWYAVMYLVAFFLAYLVFRYQCRHDGVIDIRDDEGENFFITAIIGLLIGARLFSVFFYSDGIYYLTHPWMIFWPFQNGQFVGLPGMSYHGGVVGALVGAWIYCRRHKIKLMLITDLTVAGIPLGYTFGRLGNFFNAELYGRVTTKPWGMVFPTAERFSSSEPWVQEVANKVGMAFNPGDMLNLPRHPSQLYEAFFEGIVLFLILWFIIRPLKYKKKLPDGTVFSFYLMGYGIFRFFIEYCRQPDANIGYIIKGGKGADNIALFQSFLNISEGQIFCILMVAAGALLLFVLLQWRAYDDNRTSQRAKGKAAGKGNR